MSYLTPAKTLLETGSFASEWRCPGYPFVLAGVLAITDHVGAFVVALQAVLLFATGLVAMRIAKTLAPQASLPTLIFVCFNPSALFYVQQILPDTLFAFFLILNVYFLLKASQSGSSRAAIISGICAGSLVLIRGNGQYVLWFMPLAMSAGYMMLHKRLDGLAVLRLAASSTLSTLLVTSPWLFHNWQKGDGISFITNAYRNYAIHDNVILAVALQKGLHRAEAREIVYDLTRHQKGIEEAQWQMFTVAQRHLIVASQAFDILLQGGLSDLSLAVIKAAMKLFLVSDGQTWATFWQLSAEERLKPDAGLRYSLSAAFQGKLPVSAITYACHALTISLVLLIRILDILGTIYLVRKKAWYLLVICMAYVTLFAFSAAFIGNSRYRVPVDPILMIVGAWGLFLFSTGLDHGVGHPSPSG